MEYFKVIVLIVGLIAVVSATTREEIVKMLLTTSLKCKSENGVSDAEAIAIQASKTGELKDNHLKCMVKCVMASFNVINPEGGIQEDILVKSFTNLYAAEEAKALEYAKACAEKGKAAVNTKESPCEVAAEIHKCIKEIAEKVQNLATTT